MALYLVRHAEAGERFDGAINAEEDSLRPLTDAGHQQAQHLAARFDGVSVALVLSSPYLRCLQTVGPTARRFGLEVQPTAELAEGSPFSAVLDLLARVPDCTVLCSHGDVIPDTIAALYRRGMDIGTAEDWRKGSTWVIERSGEQFVSAIAIAPPAAD